MDGHHEGQDDAWSASSPAARPAPSWPCPALEITSSTYVMHSGDILYRHVYDNFDEQVKKSGLFLTNVHSEGPNRPEDLPNARVFMDRSWLTTFSTFCTYAGNTLLLKKGNHRFAVDLANYFGGGEELSEHMFITGMKDDGGRITWFAGAAPSGCGKTTTAMAGTDFVGDDLAQMWIADDGTMRAINPENGIFGIVADVNREGDPYLMKCLREPGTEVIWSNVLIDDKKVPHWTGNGEEHPDKGFNFQGEWFKGKKDANGKEIPISHPNARCTLRCEAIENYNTECRRVARGRAGQGDHLQRPRRRHHAAGLGRQEPRPRRGHRRLDRLGGHGHRGGRHRRQAPALGQRAVHPRPAGRLHEDPVRRSSTARSSATPAGRSWPA